MKARSEKRRIEVTGLRSETATTWANPDGSFRREVSAGEVRFRDDQGDWQPVDLTLQKQADGGYAPKSHPAGLEISGARAAASGDLLSLARNGQSLHLGWNKPLPAPKVDPTDATRLVYPDVMPNVDLVVQVLRTGYEQQLVVKKRLADPSVLAMDLPMTVSGLTPTAAPAGGVNWLDGKGRKVAATPGGLMWDAKSAPAIGVQDQTAPVPVKLAAVGKQKRLSIAPSTAFLDDPDTQYPVTIDPGTTWTTTLDTWVRQALTTPQNNSTQLPAGAASISGTTRIARSLIQWGTGNLAYSQVSSASLRLYQQAIGSCGNAYALGIWQIGSFTANATWDSGQPGWEKKWYAPGTAACNGWVSADVTGLVQWWADNGFSYPNMGLMGGSESSTAYYKVFSSKETANPPQIVLTYNHAPSQAINDAPASGSITFSAPTLVAHANDADGDVRLTFRVSTDDGRHIPGGQVADTVVQVPSGTQARWTPNLSPGHYVWDVAVQDVDGAWNGRWSSPSWFIVTGSGAPVVTDVIAPTGSLAVDSPTPTLSIRAIDPDGSTITTYFYLADVGSASPDLVDGATTTTTSGATANYVIPSGKVISGHTYEWWVKACDTGGFCSDPTGRFSFIVATAPDAMTATFAGAQDRALFESWGYTDDSIQPVDGYHVVTYTSGGSVVNRYDACATCESTTVTGLSNGTSYYFTVQAFNNFGNGPLLTSDSATPSPDSTLPAEKTQSLSQLDASTPTCVPSGNIGCALEVPDGGQPLLTDVPSYQEPASDSGADADVEAVEAAFVADMNLDRKAMALPDALSERSALVNDLQAKQSRASLEAQAWDPNVVSKQTQDLEAGLLAAAGDDTYTAYSASDFTVDQWQGVQVSGSSATLLAIGHDRFQQADGWLDGETRQWQVKMANVNGSWLLSQVVTASGE